jgi:nicotinamide-nucleotide amidase
MSQSEPVVAEIVSVGTELLMGQIADTNAQHLGKLLPELGIAHTNRQTVGDNLDRLTAALKLALSRADVVFTIGGLGPTQDDLTREAIARVLDEPLTLVPEQEELIRQALHDRRVPWTDSQSRQAHKPACCRFVDNPNGTAPGLICEKAGKTIIALPGPKGEFIPMVNGPIRDHLAALAGSEVIHSRVLRICGMGESSVEERIRGVLTSTNPTVAPYAHPGEVELRISARAANLDLAEQMIAPVEQRIRSVLRDAVFGCDDMTLEQAVIEMLKTEDATVAVAESMTGGGLGDRFTSVAGAGDVFLGGIISYDLSVKRDLLKIPPDIIDDERLGPVSAPCAEAMAESVKGLLGATYGVSVTGNAGPTSDKGDKPIGLTYIGVSGPEGTDVEEHHFRGTRESIRRRAQQAALTMLRSVALKRRPSKSASA